MHNENPRPTPGTNQTRRRAPPPEHRPRPQTTKTRSTFRFPYTTQKKQTPPAQLCQKPRPRKTPHATQRGQKPPARRVGATSLGTQRSMRTPPLNTEESNPSTTQSRSQNGTTPRRTGFTPPVRDAPQRRRPGTGGGETVTQSSRLPPQPANRWTKSPHQTAYSSQGRATTAGGRPQRGTKPREESGT